MNTYYNNYRICFLGTYDKFYSRNQVMFLGLTKSGVQYDEVHAQLPQTELNDSRHLSVLQIFNRLWRKVSLFPLVLKSLKIIASCDVIFVPYPGHLDVPLAWLLGIILHKPIIFDPTFSLYQVVTSDFKLISTSHPLAYLLKLYEKIIFSLPTLVIADSNFQKEYYVQLLGISEDRVHIVPFGVNSDKYPYQGFQKDSNNIFRVIYYGLYNPLHGVEYLIQAANELRDYPDIQFVFVGRGQMYESTVKLAKEMKLENVVFHPDVTEKDALPLLKDADVFVGFFQRSNTVFRTIPNKVVQGLSLGKAVLTCETPAIKSMFEHKKNMYLCEVANAKSIAEAILDLYRHPMMKLKIAKNGYDLCEKNFVPDKIIQKVMTAVIKAVNLYV